MEIFRFNILPQEEIKRRDLIKFRVNNCPSCTEQLEFQHNYDYLFNKITENAYCPHCHKEVRNEVFDLQ